MKFRTILLTTLTLLSAAAASAQDPYAPSPSFGKTTPFPFTLEGTYNYEPTAFNDGALNSQGVNVPLQRVWWCSAGPVIGPNGPGVGDSIWYTEYPLTNVSGPVLAIGWNGNYESTGIGNVACNPTVVRITTGPYVMFFECATPGAAAVSSVCVAEGIDGYNWNVWTKDGWEPSWYGVAQAILPATDNVGIGIAHPSAVLDPTHGNMIRLYYFQQYGSGPSAMFYVLTPDGVKDINGGLLQNDAYNNPDTDTIHIKTINFTVPAKVYALDLPSNTSRETQYLATIGTQTPTGTPYMMNYYITSVPGKNGKEWYYNPTPLTIAKSEGCLDSSPAVLTDVHGHIPMGQATNPFNLYSAEGMWNPYAEALIYQNSPYAAEGTSPCWNPGSYYPNPRPLWQIYAIPGTMSNWKQPPQ